MSLVVVVPPTQAPVALTDVYDHLRLGVGLTSHPDDKRFARLIRSATALVENETRRALCQQQLRLILDGQESVGWAFGSGSAPTLLRSSWGGGADWGMSLGPIDLPRPPLLTVDAIQYWDTTQPNSVQRSVDVGSYRVLTQRTVGRIEFVSGFQAPQVDDRSDAVSVLYTAGYPPLASDDAETYPDGFDFSGNVPDVAKDAVLLLVERAYDVLLPAEEMVLDDRVTDMLYSMKIHRA